MKKLLSILLLVCSMKSGIAQLNTTLVMLNNPPGTIIEWASQKEILTYLVINVGQPARAVIKAELKTTDGTIVATTNLAIARIFNIERGTNLVLSAAEVIPLDVMIFNGRFRESMERTGKLPAGTYELCVQLVNPGDFIPVSEQRCRTFTIAAFQLPVPVIPLHESVLELDKTKTTITFRWTPVSPRPQQPVVYKLLVFEILENQTPMQALRSNQPVLVKDIVGTTQYIWQHQLALMPYDDKAAVDAGGSPIDSTTIINGVNAYGFIWTLQTFDAQNRPFGDGNINGDGITEPAIFLIDRRSADKARKAGPVSKIIYRNNFKGDRN